MAWQIILPIAASVLQSAFAYGAEARQATREQNRQMDLANLRRAELQPLIDRLREARDYFGVEEQLVRDFSRASDQMSQQSAQSGMANAGSGGLDQQRADVLGSALAELAEFKAQDQSQREQLLAKLLSDPSLYAGQGERADVGGATAVGAIGGGLAGLGSSLASFLSTPEGMQALGIDTGAGAPTNQFTNDLGSTGRGSDFGNWLVGQSGQYGSPVAPPGVAGGGAGGAGLRYRPSANVYFAR